MEFLHLINRDGSRLRCGHCSEGVVYVEKIPPGQRKAMPLLVDGVEGGDYCLACDRCDIRFRIRLG